MSATSSTRGSSNAQGTLGELRAPWKADTSADSCDRCKNSFNLFRRKHHCRRCGGIFCNDCCWERVAGISGYGDVKHRICLICKGTTALAGGTLKVNRLRERKFCVVGAAGVGKTALVSQFIDRSFHLHNTGTTGGGSGGSQHSGSDHHTSNGGSQHTSQGATSSTNSARRQSVGNNANPATAAPAVPQPQQPQTLSSSTTRSKQVKYRNADYIISILDATASSSHVTGDIFNPLFTIGTVAYLLVFSVDDRASFTAIKAIRDRILDCGGFDLPLVLVANKNDKAATRAVPTEEAAQLAQEWRVPYVEISAAKANEVDELFQGVLREVVARES